MTTEITSLPALPERPASGHKGTFGRVLIVAGSRGMSGAAALSGLGALRGGAGLVYVAVPDAILPIVASIEPSYLTVPLPSDDEGRATHGVKAAIHERIDDMDAVAIGPGLGRSDTLDDLVAWDFMKIEQPVVFDADALNAIADHPEVLGRHAGSRILTPHPGEFARLTKTSIEEVEANRRDLAIEFAARHGIVLVLKGAGTIITDGDRIAVNTTGNSGLATGGTGDVLTGLVTALLAQRLEPFDAARLGVHLHGLGADLAAAELTEAAMIASDLPRYLPRAWRELKGE